MKHKRLNRDSWGFQYYPYYQMRIDEECFHGLACLIRLTDGESNYWETPNAERIHYPVPANERYQPSIWYVDITDGIEYDEYGIAVYIDKYLDVIFTPEGDVKIDDGDELEAAYNSGELSKEQYDAALLEGDKILKELCSDISNTDKWCAEIRQIVEDRIAAGEPIKMCRYSY